MLHGKSSFAAATLIAALFATAFGNDADGAYPISSRFARQAEGPYAPQTNRYVVIDPAPIAPPMQAASPAPQAGASVGPKHGKPKPNANAAGAVYWQRHDAATTVYPYGWFGANAATQRWTHTSYYGDYGDTRFIRGR